MNGKRIASFLLVSALVASSMILLINLTAPEVEGQIYHLQMASMEDNDPAYDIDPTVGVVRWDAVEPIHVINDMLGSYMIDPGYTLEIPGGITVQFEGTGQRFDVDGTLKTEDDGSPSTFTTFTYGGFGSWDSIYVHNGGQVCIQDSRFEKMMNGLTMEPGSELINPGVSLTTFVDYGLNCIQMDGVTGYTRMASVTFDDTANPSGTAISIENGDLELRDTPTFLNRGNNKPFIYMRNATVDIQEEGLGGSGFFKGFNQAGPAIVIDEECDGTYLQMCNFVEGGAGDHYIEIEGSSPLLEDCSFETTMSGALSVLAADNETGVQSHPIVRQPTQDTQPGIGDNTFDNSTLNATGASSITLQWYIDVLVEDPDGNPINGAPVYVEDRNNNPADPPSQTAGVDGWAKDFLVTELVLYELSVTHYSPFNVSAENNSVFGYLDPEIVMDYSKAVTVVVPFSLIPNDPPTISFMTDLVGMYSGLVTIQYTLDDPNPGDDGNMSVQVFYSVGGIGWRPAAMDPSSDSNTSLNNGVMYNFVWDSRIDMPNVYEEQVYILIIPYDKAGAGVDKQEGNFTIDNQGPEFLTGPGITITNTTATITWTVSEVADASVGWGLATTNNPDFGDITDETAGTSGSTDQSVTLTGLTPGRKYYYVLYSTDGAGNKNSTYPEMNGGLPYEFETPIWIPLKTGWNMISLAPLPLDTTLSFQLSSIDPNYQIVQIYDSSDTNDPWKQWNRDKPFGNDLTDLGPEDGIWIKMTADDTLIVNQLIPLPPPMVVDIQIDLAFGWNFVGYPSVISRDVDTVLSGVIYDKVQVYDAHSDMWYHFDGPGGQPDTFTQMECGRGYWIYSSAPAGDSYSVPYA